MSERPIATPNTAYREIGDLLDFSTGGADDFAKAFSEVSSLAPNYSFLHRTTEHSI
jgi:hypothetical protein